MLGSETELPEHKSYLFNNQKSGVLAAQPNPLVNQLIQENAIKHKYNKGDVSYYKLTGVGWSYIKEATKVFGHK